MQEVTSFKIYNSKIKEDRSNISFTKAKWKGELAQLIAENFGMKIILSGLMFFWIVIIVMTIFGT